MLRERSYLFLLRKEDTSNPQGYPQRLFLLQCRYRDLLHRDHKHIRRPRKHTLSLKTPPLSSISTPIIHHPHPLVNGAEPAAASCRPRFADVRLRSLCPFELNILFRNMTVRHPAGMHPPHRRRKPKGLLWAYFLINLYFIPL